MLKRVKAEGSISAAQLQIPKKSRSDGDTDSDLTGPGIEPTRWLCH